MINLSEFQKQQIPLREIDLENNYYKLSRNIIDEKLERSISACGILDLPLLLEKDDKFIITNGHNRLGIISRLGIPSIYAIIIKELNYEILVNNALLKFYTNQIGPVGRLKLFSILKNDFNPGKEYMLRLAKIFELPVELINDTGLLDRVINLPERLKDYLDFRDINLKIIKNVLRLPDDAVQKLNEWSADMTIRTNIFKNITEYLLDIYKREKTRAQICEIDLSAIDDRRSREVFLHDQLFKTRYPEYSKLKEKADDIIKHFNSRGFKINFPEYFEGDEIELRLTVNKRDNLNHVEERLGNINIDDIKKLLELL
jgi:hypothetical protein